MGLMRVLLIEDEDDTSSQIQELLETECRASVEIVCSRDSALRTLEQNENLDLIICDLRIPTQDGSLDVAEEHGLRVYDAARDKHPGTFSRFFSGYARLENIGDRLASGPSVDVFGTGQTWAIVDVFAKSKQPEFVKWATELSNALERLSKIDINESARDTTSEYEARPLRIYAERLDGTRIAASQLSGLSGAKVFKVDVFDDESTVVGSIVARISEISLILREKGRYDRYVAPVMSIGTFAPLAGTVEHGCGRIGAVFYSFAANGFSDLFELAVANDVQAQDVIRQLRDSHERWRGMLTTTNVSIATLRSSHIRDEELAPWVSELCVTRVEETEAMTIPLRYSIQHGDLHGLNVLVDAEGRPLMIDYETIGRHPVALDPVTLELSFVFHAERPELDGWPSIDQARHWFDLQEYTSDSPIGDVIGTCRQWALAAATRKQLAAVVYAHATRQLKYTDTSKPLVLAIAKAAMTALTGE